MKRFAACCCLLILATACSSKAENNDKGSTGSDGVKAGVGVTDKTITLGVMTDQSGVFKNLATAITRGNELWVKEVNAAGGVCGRKLDLDIVDHGYKADTAKTLYPQLEPKVLGFLQLTGSPIMAALGGDVQSDKVTTTPASWSSELLSNPYVMIVGTTYDIEMIDGLSYLQSKGMIKDGDTVGHIYVDGEYGANGLRGARYYAEKHNLKLREVKLTSTDTDLTNVVTGLKGDGVKSILLTTTPGQTGSALAANKALGLNVPVLSNNPAFDPVLHKGPAAKALDKLYVAASTVPYSADIPKAKEIMRRVQVRRIRRTAQRRCPVRLRGGRGVGRHPEEGLRQQGPDPRRRPQGHAADHVRRHRRPRRHPRLLQAGRSGHPPGVRGPAGRHGRGRTQGRRAAVRGGRGEGVPGSAREVATPLRPFDGRRAEGEP